MKFVYHTKGGASPQGKYRVYYTGHPADRSAYAEEIFADILKTQDCAIYYDEEPEAPYDQEEFLQRLEQMQLFVIPVTSRFLYQPNRAREVEFAFAMERHIPVLPLLQEQGLEAAFNERCGDLQMLNKKDPDPTALPYAEKLEKFLSSVLVGDELAEKVRQAFDAYVFLSYRKKDRRYAQELMGLIHKNEFCRDVAIWYDEFLIPGENFNEAIADALGKCDLFTLAVTPHIVEPGNYVMDLEYPEARKSGKPILPVELAPTDHETLQRSFQELPPCADARDEGAFSAALLESVQKLAIRENDGSPEHNFFIGLAYLNGIDVEVDRKRALSLITGAAAKGLPEAMEKLVKMYRNGDGVARDYHAAVEWQERLALWQQERYERMGTEDEGLIWAGDLLNLGDYQKELEELPAAKEAYGKAQDLCRELTERFGSREAGKTLALLFDRQGDVGQKEGRPADAEEDYLQALGLRKGFFQEAEGAKETQEARRDLTVSYNRLGEISQSEGRLEEAESYYLQVLELRRSLCREADTAEARRDLSVSLYKLGDVCFDKGDLFGAKEYYLQDLELNRQLCRETEAAPDQRSLSLSYSGLGDIDLAEGRLGEAKDSYLQARELLGRIHEETGTVGACRDLSLILGKLGDVNQKEGKLTAARDYCLQELALKRQICEAANTPEARRDLAVGYSRLGAFAEEGGGLDEAEEACQQALELFRQLYEETGTVRACLDLAVGYDGLGHVRRKQGERFEAEEYYLQGLKLRKMLCEKTGGLEERRALSISYKVLGINRQAAGCLAEAGDYYWQALGLCKQLLEDTETKQAERDVSLVYEMLWGLSGQYDQICGYCKEQRDLRQAKELYLQDLELNRQLWKEAGWDKARRAVFVCCTNLGILSEAEGQLSLARDYYQQGLDESRRLCEKAGTPEAREDLSVSLHKLGGLSEREGDLSQARAYYLQSLALKRQLFQEVGSAEAKASLAASLHRLGGVVEAEGNLPQAKEYYLQGLELFRQILEEGGGIESQAALSSGFHKLGGLSEREGSFTEAESYYLQELELDERLCKEDGTRENHCRLTVCCTRLSGVAQAAGKGKQAEEYYLRGGSACEQLLGDVRAMLMGDKSQEFAAIREFYLQGLEVYRHTYEEAGTAEVLTGLADQYRQLGDVSLEMGCPGDAGDYYLASLEFDRRLYEETGAQEARQKVLEGYRGLGVSAQKEGRLEEAKEYYQQGLKISEEFYEETASQEAQRELSAWYNRLRSLAQSYRKMGEGSQKKEDLDQAEECFLQFSELCGFLRGKVRSQVRELWWDYVASFSKLGRVARDAGRLDQAKAYFRKGLEAAEEMDKETGDAKARQLKGMLYRRLADVSRMEGKESEAERYEELGAEFETR